MELGIQVVSVYDNKLKKASFIHELNIVENGKILTQKSLKNNSKIFDIDNKEDAEDILSSELQLFIDSVKEQYNVTSLQVLHRPSNFMESKIKTENSDIKFQSLFNPKIWNAKMIKAYSNMKSLDISENPKLKEEKPAISSKFDRFSAVKSNKSTNISKAQVSRNIEPSKVRTSLNSSKNKRIDNITIDDFVENMMKDESLQQELFKNKISSSEDIDEVFIDFAFTLEKKRKRTGVIFNYFDSQEKLKGNKNPFHIYESIGHGEINCAMHKIKQQLKENILELVEQGKKVTVNLNIRGEYHLKDFNDFFDRTGLRDKVTIISQETPLFNKTFQKLRHKINNDINIYLRELKKPETVAVFTDGSVNNKQNASGSGVVIRHQERNKLLASRNDNEPDSTYSEFKAIALACREIASNNLYKGKKIMIVSDNDLMSYSIRNKLNNTGNSVDRPYLEEICQLIEDNDMNIYFHNVKSHIHENIPREDEDKLYDFKYNNVVDLVAKAGGGMELSKREMEIISEDTEHDPKYKEKDYSQSANKKTSEEKREKRFKNAKKKQISKRKEDSYREKKKKFSKNKR